MKVPGNSGPLAFLRLDQPAMHAGKRFLHPLALRNVNQHRCAVQQIPLSIPHGSDVEQNGALFTLFRDNDHLFVAELPLFFPFRQKLTHFNVRFRRVDSGERLIHKLFPFVTESLGRRIGIQNDSRRGGHPAILRKGCKELAETMFGSAQSFLRHVSVCNVHGHTGHTLGRAVSRVLKPAFRGNPPNRAIRPDDSKFCCVLLMVLHGIPDRLGDALAILRVQITREIPTRESKEFAGIPNMVLRSPNQESSPVLTSHSQPTDFPETIASRRRSLTSASSFSTLLRFVTSTADPM